MLALEITKALLVSQGAQVTDGALALIVLMGAAPVHIFN